MEQELFDGDFFNAFPALESTIGKEDKVIEQTGRRSKTSMIFIK
jgi:hypothetical protein